MITPSADMAIEGVRVSSTRLGRGVFATRRFLKDWIVGEIRGELIDDPDYGSSYSMELENGHQLEPYAPFRFLNHCCEPNCEFDLLDAEASADGLGQRRVFLVALREIEPGEELKIDYCWPADAAIVCQCDAPSCRGWIVDPDDLWKIVEWMEK
ncbi:MAG: SET domain-containing protein [Pirellulales bacterium]|nr:SET domain-containing protein [Pirellulales bacterium]